MDDDISRQVNNALNEELAAKESQLAEKFGAIDTSGSEIPSQETIEEIKDKLDKGKDEKYDLPIKQEFPIDTKSEYTPPPKKKLKPELIEDILKLQVALGGGEYEEAKLKRLKKVELEIILSNMAEKGVSKVMGIEQAKSAQNQQNLSAADAMAHNLYGMNMLLCKTLEGIAGSEHAKEYTTINVLEGWTDQIESQKELLLQTLGEIYLKNRTTLDKLIDPIYKYAIIMMTTASLTIINNTKKKKLN